MSILIPWYNKPNSLRSLSFQEDGTHHICNRPASSRQTVRIDSTPGDVLSLLHAGSLLLAANFFSDGDVELFLGYVDQLNESIGTEWFVCMLLLQASNLCLQDLNLWITVFVTEDADLMDDLFFITACSLVSAVKLRIQLEIVDSDTGIIFEIFRPPIFS